jgi:hypothetical protein
LVYFGESSQKNRRPPIRAMVNYAIFFPQFHACNSNDAAWGKGFTDWSLISAANAFGTWERRVPVAGFYDLGSPEVVRQRFKEAAVAGLDGFAVYHYWFEDGRELSVVEDYIKDASLPENFGFFLVWANESWSKRWAGNEQEIIKRVDIHPNLDSVRRHVAYLEPILSHPACRKWCARPMFVFYRPEFFADPAATVELYRQEFAKAGLNPALGFFAKNRNDLPFGALFDFCYLFEPRLFFNMKGIARFSALSRAYRTLLRTLPYEKVEAFAAYLLASFGRESRSYFFKDFANYMLSRRRCDFVREFDCPVQNVVSCGWNNAPRYRDKFTELTTPTAEQFKELLFAVRNQSLYSSKLPLLCNAWNEWSEGAALEPCAYLGDQLLRCYVESASRTSNSAA